MNWNWNCSWAIRTREVTRLFYGHFYPCNRGIYVLWTINDFITLNGFWAITVTYSLENSFIVMSPIVVWMTASSGSFLAPSAPFTTNEKLISIKNPTILLLLLLPQLLIIKIGSLGLHVPTAEERKGTVEMFIDVHKCSHMQPSEVWEKGKANHQRALCKFAIEWKEAHSKLY